MTDTILRITAANGVTFNVERILATDPSGSSTRARARTPVPVAVFYDADQDPAHFGRLGQKITSYRVTELLTMDPGSGLNLYGGVDAWRVDSESMDQIRAWLLAHAEA